MIKVFTGPMFSGKSTMLIETYNKIFNKNKCLCFKPSKDKRDYSRLYSRDMKETIPAIVISDLSEIQKHIKEDTRTVFIDEVQFLSGDGSSLIDLSINKDIDIYIAGLSLTSELKPFGSMPNILAIADEVEHFKAYCYDCNKHNAVYTYCIADKSEDILVGNSQYIPLCSDCYRKRNSVSVNKN